MDDATRTLIIATVISVLAGIVSNFASKWFESRNKKAEQQGDNANSLSLRRFDQAETVRKEMQTKIDRLERMVERHERGFIELRDSTNGILQETLFTFQLILRDVRDKNYVSAETRLEESIRRLKDFQLPKLAPLEEKENPPGK